ncbi:MAG: hypothetical protein ACKVP7_21180 [Hyphomicrobiaceae bacterium]
MRMRARGLRIFAGVLIAVQITACAGGSGPPLQQAAPDGAAKAEPAKPYREITLPEARVGEGSNTLALTLSARLDRQTGKAQTFLRVGVVYTAEGRRNYDTVRDASGAILKSERLAGNQQCKPGQPCSYDEAWSIEIPEPALRSAKATGYRLKLFARSGPEIEIGIPGPQIAALLEKIDGAAAPATAEGPKSRSK